MNHPESTFWGSLYLEVTLNPKPHANPNTGMKGFMLRISVSWNVQLLEPLEHKPARLNDPPSMRHKRNGSHLSNGQNLIPAT